MAKTKELIEPIVISEMNARLKRECFQEADEVLFRDRICILGNSENSVSVVVMSAAIDPEIDLDDPFSNCDFFGTVATCIFETTSEFTDRVLALCENIDIILAEGALHNLFNSSNWDLSSLCQDNWQESVAKAIQELPDDIRIRANRIPTSDDRTVVLVFGESAGHHDEETGLSLMKESEILKLTITWRITSEVEFQNLSESTDMPYISIDLNCRHVIRVVPRTTMVYSFKKMIKGAVLELLFEDGNSSFVSKDANGRYCRADGTYIL